MYPYPTSAPHPVRHIEALLHNALVVDHVVNTGVKQSEDPAILNKLQARV